MTPELKRAFRTASPRVVRKPRLAGAWTRLSDDGTPLGRLHAARRVEGHLDDRALCGYKIPSKQLHLRPFPPFELAHDKACPICIAEAEDMP